MNNDNKCCGKKLIKEISCDVKNCLYHEGEDKCTAGHINVGTSYADESRETLCATFKHRTE